MKVFAEYFEDNGILYRKSTLLQFGESWNLIGSAVLANPGSAEPVSQLNVDATVLIKDFYKNYRQGDIFKQTNWHEFSPDSTMRFVEKIFNGWYVNEAVNLNGVIQLFNTFNIKNQNLEEAVSQIGIKSEHLFSYNVYDYFHDKPTYFGFSNAVLDNDVLCDVAKSIFKNSSDVVKSIYKNEFSKNSFYHPMYINNAYKQQHFQKYKQEVLSKIAQNA